MGLQCWGDTSSEIIKDKVYRSTIPSVFGSCLSDWQVMLRLLDGRLVLSSFRVILCKKTGTFSNWSTTACVVTCIAAKQTAASLWSLSIWTSVRPYLSHPNMCLSYRSSLVHRMNISGLEHNSVCRDLHCSEPNCCLLVKPFYMNIRSSLLVPSKHVPVVPEQPGAQNEHIWTGAQQRVSWLALQRNKLLPPCEAFLYEHPFVPTCPIQTCACCTGVAWCTEWTYLDWSTTACVVTCIAAKQTAASLWSLSIWTSVRPYLSHPNMCLLYGSSLVHRMNISGLEHNSVCRDLHCSETNCCLLVKPFYMNIRSSLLVPSKHVPVVRE